MEPHPSGPQPRSLSVLGGPPTSALNYHSRDRRLQTATTPWIVKSRLSPAAATLDAGGRITGRFGLSQSA